MSLMTLWGFTMSMELEAPGSNVQALLIHLTVHAG